MHRLQFRREVLVDVDARAPKKMELPVKLPEGGPPLMVHYRIGNQPDAKSRGLYTDREFDILPQPRQDKALRSLPYGPRNTHIKATGMKLPDVLLVATNSAGGEWRSHRIADGFLHGRKGLVGCVRPSIRI